MLSTHITSSNILLSQLTAYVENINWNHQFGFHCNRYIFLCYNKADCLFCTCQKWRKNGNTMRQYISYLQTSRNHIIQSHEKFCKIFSLSLVYMEHNRTIKIYLKKPTVKPGYLRTAPNWIIMQQVVVIYYHSRCKLDSTSWELLEIHLHLTGVLDPL